MAEEWFLRGEYFENCPCSISCPCSMDLSLMPSSPDGSCHVTLAFGIEQGRYGSTDLSVLNVVVVGNTLPGHSMSEGNWSVAAYFDDRASASQQEALTAIFSGQAGGLFGMLAPLMGNILGMKPARIQFEKDGKKRRVSIEGISDVEGEAIPGSLNPEQPITLNNVNIFNPAEPLTQAIVRSSSYNDYGMQWDNTGRNAYITRLDLKSS